MLIGLSIINAFFAFGCLLISVIIKFGKDIKQNFKIALINSKRNNGNNNNNKNSNNNHNHNSYKDNTMNSHNIIAVNQLTNIPNNFQSRTSTYLFKNNSYSSYNNNNNNNNYDSYPNNNQNRSTNSNDGTIVGLHFKIGKKIGEGSFGVLFEGVNMINRAPVAIKLEPRKSEAPQLKDEYRTYKIMAGTPNIPLAYYFGQEGLHNILVIDLLGPSLEDLFDWCGRKFSVKTVAQVAIQMISLLEDLHLHDLIYRDIKPDNFLIGRAGQPDENNIHLIDFGMAKQYRDPKTKIHIPYREKKSLSGTARYMSINTHLGREQSRRDDMEALGHVFFYFLRGHLPWQGLKAPNNKQKYEKIGERKRITNAYELAQGLPIQFGQYLDIVRNLTFEEAPDYEGYRRLFATVLEEIGECCDGKYDWFKLNGGRGWDPNINKKPNLHGYGHPNPPDENKKQINGISLQMKSRQTQLGQLPLLKTDPNLFQAFQRQPPQILSQPYQKCDPLQDKYMQQQQQVKRYPRKIAMTQLYDKSNQINASNLGETSPHHDSYNAGLKGYSTQPINGHVFAKQNRHEMMTEQQQMQQQLLDDLTETNKGFFAKFSCC